MIMNSDEQFDFTDLEAFKQRFARDAESGDEADEGQAEQQDRKGDAKKKSQKRICKRTVCDGGR